MQHNVTVFHFLFTRNHNDIFFINSFLCHNFLIIPYAIQPRANSRYARKNSQGGQSAIYSTAPEYDDPATCAEEDQYVRLLYLFIKH